ncbi:GTPase ObgE [Rickettsiales endosymbiont of Peranema trichophorum]|uniref:GTPase ObgE n=1 Tax=Rickettsiales endosymbiont of Peranema trichophorum TaxID=2486577 RepID=UPI001023925F|nr:GTPase ObgE [Rickettsiales endosymbiont of Peranema trichophorum]RZI47650.1 GTPase ObgE [Rickettsiales endosymbiont of Peranema trichophorum]
MRFIDEAKIYIKSGDGGNGCVSFRREKFIEFGGPDGGNGGSGGDVLFKAVNDVNTLLDFHYQQHFKASSGKAGSGRNCTGLSGEDMVISVPIGTQIYDETGENLLFDLDKDCMAVTVLKGGRGGVGNSHFKSSTNQAPRRFIPGEKGQEMWIRLQLKLLSDVGIIGLPNAGKSSFLSATTAARPKVADYPFTTLKPQLGVVSVHGKHFVMADVPGLIEGASDGHGLGDRFLRHIERCKMLLHLVDVTEDALHAYQTIRSELLKYSSLLASKPEVVVLSKVDLVSEESVKQQQKRLEKYIAKKVLFCSSVTGLRVVDVLEELHRYI